MIQDIYPHIFNNTYIHSAEISRDDYIFHFKNNSLLLKQSNGHLEIPTRKELQGNIAGDIFMFTLNDINCFLKEECIIPEDAAFSFHDISFFRTILQKEIAWSSIIALQLMNWYKENKYCGKCGSELSQKTNERALICNCGNIIYPKISPAIIVAITCNDNILLAKGINFRGGFYSLIAGYSDIGESLEETVKREVKEETGLDVNNIRYYGSQPWPLSGSLMIGFIATADDSQPIVIDKSEISEARWFHRDDLPKYPPASIGISGEMIDKFKNGILI